MVIRIGIVHWGTTIFFGYKLFIMCTTPTPNYSLWYKLTEFSSNIPMYLPTMYGRVPTVILSRRSEKSKRTENSIWFWKSRQTHFAVLHIIRGCASKTVDKRRANGRDEHRWSPVSKTKDRRTRWTIDTIDENVTRTAVPRTVGIRYSTWSKHNNNNTGAVYVVGRIVRVAAIYAG